MADGAEKFPDRPTVEHLESDRDLKIDQGNGAVFLDLRASEGAFGVAENLKTAKDGYVCFRISSSFHL
jgi:hypothetical protein